MPIVPGQIILNKYFILKLLGEGSSGRVWLAEETTFSNRQVAIKEPRTDLPADELVELQRYYQQELKICALLEQTGPHHVVRTFTVEPYNDRLLLVMAYMPGNDLANMLHHQRDLMPIDRAVRIARDILGPLQVAHAHPQGIVHRDIKPQNILFDVAGNSYLSDWGLAQLSGVSGRSQLSARAHPGSPLYMAPEQARSADYLTPAADIYAVGCVLFELLTGKRYKHVRPGTTASSLRSNLPAWLDQVISKALAEDPFDRYEDAAAMSSALVAVASTDAQAANQLTSVTPKFISLKPARVSLWIGVGSIIVVLLLIGVFYLRYKNSGQKTLVEQGTVTPTIAVSEINDVTAISTSSTTKIVLPAGALPTTSIITASTALVIVPTALFTMTPSATALSMTTPLSTVTVTPSPQLSNTPTPNFQATQTTQNNETATAIAAMLTTQPTATPAPPSTNTATSTVIPTNTVVITPPPVSTSTPNLPATQTAESIIMALAVTATFTAQPTPTSGARDEVSPSNISAVSSDPIIPLPVRIGFVSAHNQNDKPIIYTMNTSNRQVTKIVQGADPAWSPDGKTIVYGSSAGVISIVDVDGTNVRTLTDQNDWQPFWSPDGNQIVFMSARSGKRHIYKMDKNGQNQIQLTNHAFEDRHPTWSPNGATIAFISNRSGKWQVWLMTSNGTDQVQFTDGEHDYYRPTWSPTSQQIVFGAWTGSRNELWIKNIDQSATKSLVTASVYKLEGEGYGLSWSQSGWVGYVSEQDGRPQIYAIRTDGTSNFRVTDSNTFDYFPVWLEN